MWTALERWLKDVVADIGPWEGCHTAWGELGQQIGAQSAFGGSDGLSLTEVQRKNEDEAVLCRI